MHTEAEEKWNISFLSKKLQSLDRVLLNLQFKGNKLIIYILISSQKPTTLF